ncbi:DUF3592 domain-containing protein [Streptomyces puniciscabiei]
MDGLIGAGVPLLIGSVFMAAGLVSRRRTRRLRQEGAKARGRVVRLESRRDIDTNSRLYSPVIQWVTGDGRTVENASSIASSTVGDLRPGAEVTVFYDPDNPKRMLIDGYDGRAFVVVFCALGAVGLAAGLLVIWFLVI